MQVEQLMDKIATYNMSGVMQLLLVLNNLTAWYFSKLKVAFLPENLNDVLWKLQALVIVETLEHFYYKIRKGAV